MPQSITDFSKSADAFAAGILGEGLPPDSYARGALRAYLHIAGIDSGYGFFAPNVPDSYSLGFDIYYSDRPAEHGDLSQFFNARDLRLATFLDELGHAEYDVVRGAMVKLLTYSLWREHPDATRIRITIHSLILPSISQALAGSSGEHQFLYAYDYDIATGKPPDGDNPEH